MITAFCLYSVGAHANHPPPLLGLYYRIIEQAVDDLRDCRPSKEHQANATAALAWFTAEPSQAAAHLRFHITLEDCCEAISTLAGDDGAIVADRIRAKLSDDIRNAELRQRRRLGRAPRLRHLPPQAPTLEEELLFELSA